MKQCSKCKEVKPTDQFPKDRSRPDGLYPSCKACRSAYAAKRYREVLQHDPEYMEKQRLYARAYVHPDPERKKEVKERSEKKRRHNDPVLNQRMNLRSILSNAMRGKCFGPTQERIIGCTYQQFRDHIESQFTDDMSWDNYGDWELHHIVPASKGTDMSLLELLFNFNNIVPLSKSRNAEIGDSIEPSLLTEWHWENLSGLISE